jgi:hypothetical protein
MTLILPRRSFLAAAALMAAAPMVPQLRPSAARAARRLSEGEKLGIGFIGMGIQNRYHLGWFLKRDDVRVVAVCAGLWAAKTAASLALRAPAFLARYEACAAARQGAAGFLTPQAVQRMEAALHEGYRACDEQLLKVCAESQPPNDYSSCTSVTVLLSGEVLSCAHLGDSKIVLGREVGGVVVGKVRGRAARARARERRTESGGAITRGGAQSAARGTRHVRGRLCSTTAHAFPRCCCARRVPRARRRREDRVGGAPGDGRRPAGGAGGVVVGRD